MCLLHITEQCRQPGIAAVRLRIWRSLAATGTTVHATGATAILQWPTRVNLGFGGTEHLHAPVAQLTCCSVTAVPTTPAAAGEQTRSTLVLKDSSYNRDQRRTTKVPDNLYRLWLLHPTLHTSTQRVSRYPPSPAPRPHVRSCPPLSTSLHLTHCLHHDTSPGFPDTPPWTLMARTPPVNPIHCVAFKVHGAITSTTRKGGRRLPTTQGQHHS